MSIIQLFKNILKKISSTILRAQEVSILAQF